MPWALSHLICKFGWSQGYKKLQSSESGENSADSSAHVRAGGERKGKEQEARDFLE